VVDVAIIVINPAISPVIVPPPMFKEVIVVLVPHVEDLEDIIVVAMGGIQELLRVTSAVVPITLLEIARLRQ